MKTWKKAAIGGLITLVSLSYLANRRVEIYHKVKELASVNSQLKLKEYYELRHRLFSLNLKFYNGNTPENHQALISTFDDPNRVEDMQKTIQNYSKIYKEFIETKSQLEELSKDDEFRNLKRIEDSKQREYDEAFPFGSGSELGLVTLGMLSGVLVFSGLYTMYALNLIREEKQEAKNK